MANNKYTQYPVCNLESLLKWKDGINLKIEFTNNLIVEYDKIKNPISFIVDLLNSYYEINWNGEEFDIVKNYISRISVKRLGT